jgi:LysR family glycine cleavage system transcriptional activator
MGPGALIGADLAAGRLVTPFPHLAMPARSYCAYVPAQASGDARITAFCDWLERAGIQ